MLKKKGEGFDNPLLSNMNALIIEAKLSCNLC